MAVRLVSLRHAPEEEAQAIRQLLEENQIEFYETSTGNWGISPPAVWLRHEDDLERARQLMEEFQQSWTQKQREHHARLRERGEMDSFIDRLRQNPLQVILYLAFVLLILYFSTRPFLSLGQ